MSFKFYMTPTSVNFPVPMILFQYSKNSYVKFGNAAKSLHCRAGQTVVK